MNTEKNSLENLINAMGFTFRQLADVLCISVSAVHAASRGVGSLTKLASEILAHPLFHFQSEDLKDIQSSGIWLDEQPEKRKSNWRFRLSKAIKRKEKLEEEKENMEKRNLQLQRILSHTRDLPEETTEKTEKMAVSWWGLQRSKAELEIREQDFETYQKLKLDLACLDTEIKMLEGFVG